MKALKAFIKPFDPLQRSVKNLIWSLFQYNFQKYTGREGLISLLTDKFTLFLA